MNHKDNSYLQQLIFSTVNKNENNNKQHHTVNTNHNTTKDPSYNMGKRNQREDPAVIDAVRLYEEEEAIKELKKKKDMEIKKQAKQIEDEEQHTK